MNLRDIVNENETLEGLRVLLDQPFDYDWKDSILSTEICLNHQERRKATIDPNEKCDDPNCKGPYVHQDYSTVTKIILSYCYHNIQKVGASEQTLQVYREIMPLFDEYYQDTHNFCQIRPPTHTHLSEEEIVKKMSSLPITEREKIILELEKGKTHFHSVNQKLGKITSRAFHYTGNESTGYILIRR